MDSGRIQTHYLGNESGSLTVTPLIICTNLIYAIATDIHQVI
jgi:hypothetical protein